ncbi:hypothetical protein HPB49_015229 [Dermacentor silvarum]|uniref:Uncharacterized protein n=1 Tax=Dermacentor silvarum TaxID=543639 RepID=A0ACB8CLN2_DERSI|nr:hypothetical protein HPB49_015229 [Dermacentor silvarum]
MYCEVEGEILTPEDFTKDSEWQIVAARRSSVRRRNAAANQIGANVADVQPNAGSNTLCRPDLAAIKSKVIRGGRMPPLPKEEAKIIVRPRGGMCISKVGPTAVADATWQAAGLDSATQDTDTMCPNFQRNIMQTPTLSIGAKPCDPKCKLCGGDHLTAAQECKRRFQTPYVIRRRWGKRSRALNNANQSRQASPQRRSGRSRSPSRGRSRSRGRTSSRTISRSRSGSRVRSRSISRSDSRGRQGSKAQPSSTPQCTSTQCRRQPTLVWADLVRPKPGANTGAAPAPRNDPPPEQARDVEVIRLRKENDDLKNTINRLVNEMAEIKKLVLNASVNDAAVKASETPITATVDEVSEIKQTLTALADSLKQVAPSVSFRTDSARQIQVVLGDLKRNLGALADRIDTIEARMASHATVVQPLLREARLENPTNAPTEGLIF